MHLFVLIMQKGCLSLSVCVYSLIVHNIQFRERNVFGPFCSALFCDLLTALCRGCPESAKPRAEQAGEPVQSSMGGLVEKGRRDPWNTPPTHTHY